MFSREQDLFNTGNNPCIYRLMLQRPKRPRPHENWDVVGRPGTSERPKDPRMIRMRSRCEPRMGVLRPPRYLNDGPEDYFGSGWNRFSEHPMPGEMEMVEDSSSDNYEELAPPRPLPPLPGVLMLQESGAGPSSSNSNTNNRRVEPTVNFGDAMTVVNRLWSILECPVCYGHVSPPILQCREGHLVCSGCKPRLDDCPKCRQPFADIRARALEQVAEALPYPCNNSGCNSIFKLAEKKDHESTCPHRDYICIVGECNWLGKRTSLSEHMLLLHPDYIVSSDKHELVFIITPCKTEEKIFLMQCFDELFHCVMTADSIRDIFVGYVMHMGSKEKALEFDFELKFMRQTPPYTSVVIKRTALEESPLGFQASPSSTLSTILISFSTLQEVIINDNPNSVQLKLYLSILKKNSTEEVSAPTDAALDSSLSSSEMCVSQERA